MINQYRIFSLLDFGLPGVEVHGDRYHALDIYELIGKQQFSTTFTFKEGSKACDKYGRQITGFASYDPKEKAILESCSEIGTTPEIETLKIDVNLPSLSANQKHQIRYVGVSISDLESFCFLQYKQPVEVHPSGEKKVPNIIEIEADLSDIDPDVLLINYLLSKLRRGVRLIDFERDQLVGLLLATNNFQIAPSILDALALTVEQVKGNHAIWRHTYLSFERKGKITPERELAFNEIKLLDTLERIAALSKEISNAKISTSLLQEHSEVIRSIWEQVTKFKPAILLHGKQQVYWNLQSYLHISLRHIKYFQLGTLRQKTPFVYRASDLSSLIEKVIRCVEDDLRIYLSSDPDRPFKRHGKMAIEFNGDYYHLFIEPSGRLAQFHMVGTDNRGQTL